MTATQIPPYTLVTLKTRRAAQARVDRENASLVRDGLAVGQGGGGNKTPEGHPYEMFCSLAEQTLPSGTSVFHVQYHYVVLDSVQEGTYADGRDADGEPLPSACMNGTCACAPTEDGADDAHEAPAVDLPCDGCGALAREACRPGCTATADQGWYLKVGGQGGDSCTEYGSLPEALDAWREVLETQPLADIQVLLGDRVYADVAEHDTCTVHRDAVFSKEQGCPVCDEERWHDDPAGAERDADARTARVIRSLLARDAQQRTFDINHTPVLTDAERQALDSVLFVLGG